MADLKFKLSGKGEVVCRKLKFGFKAKKVYTALAVNSEGDLSAFNDNGVRLLLVPQWYEVVEE